MAQSIRNALISRIQEMLEPFAYRVDYEQQARVYRCHGCHAEFFSKGPEWPMPTHEMFPHEAECEVIKLHGDLQDLKGVKV